MALQDPDLRIDIDHLDGGVRVRLIGELDLATADVLREGLASLVHRYDAQQLTLECGGLRFIDVYGLGRLIDVLRRFGDTGRVTVTGATPWFEQLVRVLELDSYFRLDLQGAV